MLRKEELIELFNAYNKGECSFAEVLLVSGKTLRQLIAFIEENEIKIEMNFGFINKGRGLNEDELQSVLDGF